MQVTVTIDADEVLEELDLTALKAEVARREGQSYLDVCDGTQERTLLERSYYQMRGKECPEPLREFFYLTLGRIL